MASTDTTVSDRQQARERVGALLATKTVEELKKMEILNRLEIEDKREALRKLIGSRYHDILDSATAINEMKMSVGLLYEDLLALRKYIPAVNAYLGETVDKDAHRSRENGENAVFDETTSIFRNLSHTLPYSLYVRRLVALADAPDAIDRFIADKRWTQATSVYMRSLKLLNQVSRFSPSEPIDSPYHVSLDASVFIGKQREIINAMKAKIVSGARTFLARAKLFHRVALEDNLKNSQDVSALLQEWKVQLEAEKDVRTSVMVQMIESSKLRSIAGISASLDHCALSFASALASISLLENVAPSEVLKSFLSLRLATMRHILHLANPRRYNNPPQNPDGDSEGSRPKGSQFVSHSSVSSSIPFDATHFALTEWIRSLQWTIYLIHAIFLPPHSSSSQKDSFKSISQKSDQPVSLPLLNLVTSSMIARQFGSSLQSASTCLGEAVLTNLQVSIDSSLLSSQVSQWISQCVQIMPGAIPYDISTNSATYNHNQTVLSQIKCGKDLSHLESSVAYQIENPLVKYAANENEHQQLFSFPTSSPTWSGASTPNRSGSSTPRSATSSSFWTSPSSQYSTPISAFGGMSASALLASVQLPKWKLISSRVCGRALDLWTTFFHNLFLLRAQYIIETSFLHVSLDSQIQMILENGSTAGLRLHTDKRFANQSISSLAIIDESELGEYVWSTREMWNTHQVDLLLDHAHALTPALKSLVSAFDAHLRGVMDDLRPLLIIEDEIVHPNQGTHSDTDSSSSASADDHLFPPQPISSPYDTEYDPQAPIVRRRYRPSTKQETLPTLRSCIQQNCVLLVERISGELNKYIQSFDGLKDSSTLGSSPLPLTMNASTMTPSSAPPSATVLSLSSNNNHKELIANMHKTLFFGRLSRALDTHSTQLRMILWQLEWTTTSPGNATFPSNGSNVPRTSRPTTATPTSSSAHARISGPKWMDRLSRKPLSSIESLNATTSSTLPSTAIQFSLEASAAFQQTYHLAFSKWVTMVTQELTEYLEEKIEKPSNTNVPIRFGWVNVHNVSSTSITSPSTSTSSIASPSSLTSSIASPSTSTSSASVPPHSSPLNSPLNSQQPKEVLAPSQPSTAILSWLREIVGVIYRAGAHNVDRFILEYLVYCLSHAASRIFEKRIQSLTAQNAWERDLALQLWFDLRFVFDVLSKRTLNHTFFKTLAIQRLGLGTEAKWDDVGEAVAFNASIDRLLTALKAKLDPVEASFYAPHIAQNAKAALKPYSALLGLLMAKPTSDPKRSSTFTPIETSSANTLPCVPPATRFATLPISTPSLNTLREQLQLASSASSANASSVTSIEPTPQGASQIPVTPVDLTGKSRQALEAAGAFWGKLSEGVKGSWFS